jgi:hypothetical protein
LDKTMSFSFNGIALGVAFSEAAHGSNPQGDGVLENRYGPSWDSGFFPCVTIDGGESAVINLGQMPFKYGPVGFTAVAHNEKSDHNPLTDGQLPYDLASFDSVSKEWQHAQYGEGGILAIEEEHGIFCVLQPSMRLCLQVPVCDVEGTISIEKISSSRGLKAMTWMHCAITLDIGNNTVLFMMDGQEDVRVQLAQAVCRNLGPVGLGVQPSGFNSSPFPGTHMWLSDFTWASKVLDPRTVIDCINYPPLHMKMLKSIGQSLIENSGAKLSIRKLIAGKASPLQAIATDILFIVANALPDDSGELLIEECARIDGVAGIVAGFLDTLESYGDTKSTDSGFVDILKKLAMISFSSIGRAILIRLDGMLRLLAVMPSSHDGTGPAMFWAECCIAHLHVPRISVHFEACLDEPISSRATVGCDDLIFFREPVEPFSPVVDYPGVWKKMPLAVWVS